MTDDQAVYILSVAAQQGGPAAFFRPETVRLEPTQLRRLAREGRVRHMRLPVSLPGRSRDTYAPLAA